MNPDTTSDPESLLEYLCAFADRRRVARLHQFRDLCRQHHERGSLDFRLVTIAALALEQFEYTEASLRGGSATVYRQYINAFARSVGGYTKRPPPGVTWRRSAASPLGVPASSTTASDATQGTSTSESAAPMTFLFGDVTDSLVLSPSVGELPKFPWERDQAAEAIECSLGHHGSSCFGVPSPSLRWKLRDVYRLFERTLRDYSRPPLEAGNLLCG